MTATKASFIACEGCGARLEGGTVPEWIEWSERHTCDPKVLLAKINAAWTCLCEDKGYTRLRPNEHCPFCGASRVLRRKDSGHLERTVPMLVKLFEELREDIGNLVEFASDSLPVLKQHGHDYVMMNDELARIGRKWGPWSR